MADENKMTDNTYVQKGVGFLKKYKILIGLAVFSIITIVSFMAMKTDSYEVLYPNLSESDKQQILVELSKMGVDYQQTEEGTGISIKSQDVSWVRAELSDMGLPTSEAIGFNSTGESTLGATQFDKENKQLQDTIIRLEKTLTRNYDVIESATVNAVFPKEKSIFDEKNEEGKASVVLKLKTGKQLTTKQLQGVQLVVSSAIPSIKPENVIVTDTEQGLLNGMAEEDTNSSSYEKQLAIQNETETILASDITDSLTKTFGTDGVKVDVNAKINFDEIVQNIENYQDPGVLRSRQNNKESTDKIEGEVTQEAGTDANGEVINYDIGVDDGTVLYQQDKEEIIENFEISKTVETIKKSPSLENVNVVVWVDDKIVQEQGIDVNTLIDPVALAAGLVKDANGNFTNGQVSIMPMFMQEQPEDETKTTEETQPEDFWTTFIKKHWLWIAIGVGFVTIMLLILIFVLLKRKKKKEKLKATFSSDGLKVNENGEPVKVLVDDENNLVGEKDKGTSTGSNTNSNISNSQFEQLLNETEEEKRQREMIEKYREEMDNQVKQLSNEYPRETADYIKKLLNERR